MAAQPADIVKRYDALVAGGEIEPDAAQARVAARLGRLQRELSGYGRAGRGRALGWLFAARSRPAPPKGVYIHGAVGRGKTMLMDLFFASTPDVPSRRVHFHEFMAEVHERIHAWRQDTARAKARGEDAVSPVADAIAADVVLLCFDEFHVTDIADAMILGRLFARLFAKGVVVVATSNAAPDELYANGLNRPLFLPFIDLLRERLDVLRLDARADYRLEKLAGQPVYFHPLGASADRAMDALWLRMTGTAAGAPESFTVKGRTLTVPRSAKGVARFTFADLCEQPLGTSDYLKIARTFHTVFIDHIPQLDPSRRNEARRFINLIDTLYDNHVKLVASAEVEAAAIYAAGDEAELFVRTASRLIEMRSDLYLQHGHGLAPAMPPG